VPPVRRCPNLGLDDDQFTCMTFATENHHCYRLAKHKAIPLDHQYEFCLSEDHIRCPVFLTGDRLFPKVAKTPLSTAQSAVAPQPIRLAIPKPILKWVVTISAILMLAIVTWWAIAKTDLFTRTDPPVQAAGDLPPGITPTVTRTEVEFTPNLTLMYDLTAVVTNTKNSQLSQAIPVTGEKSSTATKSPLSTSTPTKIACTKPDGWVIYTVKLWDDLYWLSLSVRSTVSEIMAVNCLSSQTLTIGQQIFLPYLPPKVTYTASSTSTFTQTYLPPTIIPSRTPTRTPTKTFTPQPTLTYTFTPIPPTATDIPPTQEPTAEPTQIPTETPTEEPTAEATPTPEG